MDPVEQLKQWLNQTKAVVVGNDIETAINGALDLLRPEVFSLFPEDKKTEVLVSTAEHLGKLLQTVVAMFGPVPSLPTQHELASFIATLQAVSPPQNAGVGNSTLH